MCNQNCNQGRNCTCGPRWVPKWHFWAALAAVVIVATLTATGAHASCVRIAADGTEGPCPAQVQREPVANPQQASASPCTLGGKLAYDAYLLATPDAMWPSANRLHYAVDYLGDMMVAKHDRAVAHKGVEIIAIRLQATGMRKPWEGAAYEVAREFIVKECNK